MLQLQRRDRPQSHEKLREVAAELYRQERFGEALKILNGALSGRRNDPDIGLFDLRAATHAKMASYPSALSDARKMIEGWKSNAMGYLRAGKILLLMGNKTKEALRIYERGLKYVSKTDSHYLALRNARDKVSKLSASEGTQDLLAVLPLDILEIIFAYVGFGQLCRCLNVSKQWRQFLTSWPYFWLDIDLSNSKRAVPVTSVYSYLEYSQLKATRVVLKSVELQHSRVLANITSRCKNLLKLEITTGGLLGESLRKAVGKAVCLQKIYLGKLVPVDGQTVRQLVQLCPNLAEATFEAVERLLAGITHDDVNPWGQTDFPNLRSFSLAWLDYENVQKGIEKDLLFPPAGNLRSLVLKDLWTTSAGHEVDLELLGAKTPRLENLELIGLCHSSRSSDSIQLPPTLQSLRLGHNYQTHLRWHRLFSGDTELPDLRAVEVSIWAGDHRLFVREFCEFLDCSTNHRTPVPLKGMLVDFESALDGDVLGMIQHSRLEGLERLRLRGITRNGDRLAQAVAEHMKWLRYLDISETRVTGVGVKCLVQSLQSLRTLVVDACPDIGSDAIEWARSQGVVISNSPG